MVTTSVLFIEVNLSGVNFTNIHTTKYISLKDDIKPTIFIPIRITETNETCLDKIFTDVDNFETIIVDHELSGHTSQVISLKYLIVLIRKQPMKLKRKFNKNSVINFKNIIH